MTALELNYAVNFVIPEEYVWEDIRAGRPDLIDEQKLSDIGFGSRNSWVGRTYFELQKVSSNVTHSPNVKPDAINFVAPRDFGRRDRHPAAFILWPRADGHRPMLANYTLVQSAAVPLNKTTSYMPLWPQANIRPRNHDKRQGIKRVSFKGRLPNLAPQFRSQDFIDRLSAMGIAFEIDGFEGLFGEQDWGDYTDSDITLAVRNKTYKDALHKPPSKLVNAWFGETPAILGPEPAYQSIRKSPLDYMEVSTPDEAIAALVRLNENPALYQQMVENGRQRRLDFSVAQLASSWVDLINNKVGPEFERWQRKSAMEKRLMWAAMMVTEPISKRYYQYYIRHGKMILPKVEDPSA